MSILCYSLRHLALLLTIYVTDSQSGRNVISSLKDCLLGYHVTYLLFDMDHFLIWYLKYMGWHNFDFTFSISMRIRNVVGYRILNL